VKTKEKKEKKKKKERENSSVFGLMIFWCNFSAFAELSAKD
jgi:hypothetical protein